MKERSTMERLMQEGWIPVLSGILSASVIVSLAHSTGMAYVTAFLLLTLYFVAIAANRVNARAVVAVAAKRISQKAIQKFSEVLHMKELDDFRRNVLSLWSMQIDLARNQIDQLSTALTNRFAGIHIESMLPAFIGSTSVVYRGGLIVLLKNSKIVVGKLIQSFKSAA